MCGTRRSFCTRIWRNVSKSFLLVEHKFLVLFYAKGQTGQQLLLGAYSALSKQVHDGRVKLYTRYEMEDVVIVDEHARGIIAKNLVTGKLERFSANAVVIATGGYGNAYFLSTNAMGCNCTAAIQCYRKGAYFANPASFKFTQLVFQFTVINSRN